MSILQRLLAISVVAVFSAVFVPCMPLINEARSQEKPKPTEQELDYAKLQSLWKTAVEASGAYGVAKICGKADEQAQTKEAMDKADKAFDEALRSYLHKYDPEVKKALKEFLSAAGAQDAHAGTQAATDAAKKNWRDKLDAAKSRIKDQLAAGKPLSAAGPLFCPRRGEATAWAGGFGGAQFVSSWSRVQTTEYSALTGEPTNQFTDCCTGAGGGINGGYNWLFSNNLLVGVVFDTNLLNDSVRHGFPGGTFIGSTIDWTASAQLRAGALIAPNMLFYGQTGLGVANQRLQINFGGPVTDQSQVTPGFMLGGGGEWMLARNVLPFGSVTSLFLDYTHTWWNKAQLNMPAASPGFNYTWERQSDMVKGGVHFYFGAPAAPSPSPVKLMTK